MYKDRYEEIKELVDNNDLSKLKPINGYYFIPYKKFFHRVSINELKEVKYINTKIIEYQREYKSKIDNIFKPPKSIIQINVDKYW